MEKSIESIISPQDRFKWMKLDDDHELVKLHRKFWLEGEYWNRLLNLPWHEDADEDDGDESADEGDGHGIRSGYVLDLDMDFGRSSVWVRKEYIRMYKRCTDHLGAAKNTEETPSVVITGQPGIGRCSTRYETDIHIDIYWFKGKSYWILYAICRRLTQMMPTMWYRGGTLFLFVKEGVFRGDRDFSCTEFRSRVWTLTDADEGPGVPTSLAAHDTRCLVIFTSYPKPARWKGLTKTTFCVEVIMNPWSRREISNASVIYFYPRCSS
jgi:hypothetical protein